jgi:outer membrane protein insertion porin family
VLRIGLTYDRRDDPGLPTQGTHLRVQADAGTRLIGSAYDFVRLQAHFRQWVPLASHHTLRFGLFGGVVLGDAPFFYRFHASDMTDLIPARLLEMELDRRPPPNLLGTSIVFMRNEEVALRADIEYNVSLLRHGRRGGLRGAHAYFNVGTYLLADIQDLEFAVPGFEGASGIPIDLTFDLGIRLDTSIGVFQFGFSNLLGFIDL